MIADVPLPPVHTDMLLRCPCECKSRRWCTAASGPASGRQGRFGRQPV